MKWVVAFVKQYIIEFVMGIMLLIFIVQSFVQGTNIFLATLINLLFVSFIYVILYWVKPFVFWVTSKKKGKVLQLTKRNEICMMAQNFDDVRYFREDMNDILEYAKQKGIEEMHAKTHKIFVMSFLKEYTTYSRTEINRMICGMDINEIIEVDTDFGKTIIIYIGRSINNCNRYNKNKKGLSKLVEKKDTYKMNIYVKN